MIAFLKKVFRTEDAHSHISSFLHVLLKTAVIVAFVSVVSGGIFYAGVLVGYGKAQFTYQAVSSFDRLFDDGPFSKGRGGFMPRQYFNPHGVMGRAISMQTSTNGSPATQIILQTRDGNERTILATSATVVREGRHELSLSDIRYGDMLVVIGAPDHEGQIIARLIRITPKSQR